MRIYLTNIKYAVLTMIAFLFTINVVSVTSKVFVHDWHRLCYLKSFYWPLYLARIFPNYIYIVVYWIGMFLILKYTYKMLREIGVLK